jgi:hypothetical protein
MFAQASDGYAPERAEARTRGADPYRAIATVTSPFPELATIRRDEW